MEEKRRVKKVKGKTIAITAIVLAVLAGLGALGIRRLQRKVTAEYGAKSGEEIQTAEVTRGAIRTTVSGSGTLEDEEYEEVEIRESLIRKNTYVEVGDTVAEGDLLVTVDPASVMEVMSDLQRQIDALDKELAEVASEEGSRSVTAPVDGRVKAIYGKKGTDVPTVMAEQGALILLSLDGTMALDVPAGDKKTGDTLTVKVKDTSYTGTVDAVSGGTATVLISDQTAAVGAEASCELGSGSLYIHQPLAVTEYTGTVSSVSVEMNQKVTAGKTLLKLTDAFGSAGYTRVLKERSELEEDMKELAILYQNSAVTAPCSGTIKVLEDNVISICPGETMLVSVPVDESDILSVEIGQQAALTIESLGEDSFEGTVSAIEKEGTSSDGVTTYTVTVQMARADGMLPGMTASVRIVTEGKEDALTLPVDAIRRTRSTAYVYTARDEQTGELGGMREVVIGMTNGSVYEIVEGVSEGDVIYYTKPTSSRTQQSQWKNRGDRSGQSSGIPGGMPGEYAGERNRQRPEGGSGQP